MSTRRHLGQGSAALAAVGIAAVTASGCLDRPLGPVDPRTTSTVHERLTQGSVDKIDLLLAIDNSKSMADKQAILALAVPDLVRGLLNPRCVDLAGAPSSEQPAGPMEPCPAGTEREFEPVLDVHVGIISSSLGGHGGTYCPDLEVKEEGDACIPGDQTSNNDRGHLLSRVDPYSADRVPTYQGKGFLAWDPGAKLDPPGEAVIEDGDAGLGPALEDMVTGVGQRGCGFEAQLESWYRFLADPAPYGSIKAVNGQVVREGVDEALLAQRAEFLRPGSLLAIVMLTDENDCSIIERGDAHRVADPTPMARPRQECAENPDSACCKPCDEDRGACPEDPTCFDASGAVARLEPEDDRVDLRCFDQKRRFGADLLYPVERYVNALTKARIDPSRDTLEVAEGEEGVENPIFADPIPGDGLDQRRAPNLVFFAGIVGVPWQDIARDPSDLREGFKTAAELGAADAGGRSVWDIILGDPGARVPPLDPLMRESFGLRAGENPVTGEPMATPATPNANSINGHDRSIPDRDDLQYACIFPLLPDTERDCAAACARENGCDCRNPENDDPLCDVDPGKGTPTRQARGKAYPGLRQLGVLKGLEDQGIVGSVCPAQLGDAGRDDYGYRPAIGAIVDKLKQTLATQCLPRTLTPDERGQVSCLIIEARDPGGECTCDPADARFPVQTGHEPALDLPQRDAATSGRTCFCEVPQLEGEALEVCRNEPGVGLQAGGKPVDGWCYIDATTIPPTGNPDLIGPSCSPAERRLIRFVGEGKARGGAAHYITCAGE